jgi:hypothetical protein
MGFIALVKLLQTHLNTAPFVQEIKKGDYKLIPNILPAVFMFSGFLYIKTKTMVS